jgi:hypothetical protein
MSDDQIKEYYIGIVEWYKKDYNMLGDEYYDEMLKNIKSCDSDMLNIYGLMIDDWLWY